MLPRETSFKPKMPDCFHFNGTNVVVINDDEFLCVIDGHDSVENYGNGGEICSDGEK